MNAADATKLPTITTALTNLRNDGLAIGVEVLGIQMTVNEKPVQYVWDSGTGEWQISAQ